MLATEFYHMPVGAQENHCRGRINTLFVGPPGTAKPMLARKATKLVRNSRYVTAQNASGKSLATGSNH